MTHGFTETEAGVVTLKCSPDSESQTFLTAGTVPLASLAEIELAVVVARSGDGQLVSHLAEPAAQTLPNGRLLEFESLTHFGPLQDPVTVANAVRSLVSSASP